MRVYRGSSSAFRIFLDFETRYGSDQIIQTQNQRRNNKILNRDNTKRQSLSQSNFNRIKRGKFYKQIFIEILAVIGHFILPELKPVRYMSNDRLRPSFEDNFFFDKRLDIKVFLGVSSQDSVRLIELKWLTL